MKTFELARKSGVVKVTVKNDGDGELMAEFRLGKDVRHHMAEDGSIPSMPASRKVPPQYTRLVGGLFALTESEALEIEAALGLKTIAIDPVFEASVKKVEAMFDAFADHDRRSVAAIRRGASTPVATDVMTPDAIREAYPRESLYLQLNSHLDSASNDKKATALNTAIELLLSGADLAEVRAVVGGWIA